MWRPSGIIWEGTASVAAGEATGEWVLTEGNNISAGDDGTILFGFVREPSGLMLLVK